MNQTRIGLLALLLVAAPARAQLLINEVLADPARDWNGDGATHSRDDEWVEIVNASVGTVDLAGYRLASPDTTWRFELSGSLGPGGVRVVYGREAYEWEQATGNPAFGFRLSNEGGSLLLFRLGASDTTVVDEISYLDEDAEDDRSAGRLESDPTDWVLFDGLNRYDGDPPPVSTGCPPTPGGTNHCLTPAREQSWSEIKSLYQEPGGSE
jgi:hypothetical protein